MSSLTFASFSRLPYELRSHIWSFAAEPRHITNMRAELREITVARGKKTESKTEILYETTATPPPAVVQVCRESRQHAPYQRAFTAGVEPRWTWVNFDLDIFCITSVYNLEDIVSHRSQVQRLKVWTVEDWDWYESVTYGSGLRCLPKFPGLREVQVALERGDIMWADVFSPSGRNFFSMCPGANVSFLDEGTGLVLTGPQLQMTYYWRTQYSFDRCTNPPDAAELSHWIQWVNGNDRRILREVWDVD